MMWASLRQKFVSGGNFASVVLGKSLQATQPNFTTLSESYSVGKALLFGKGSNSVWNVGSYVYLGSPLSSKPLSEVTSWNIKAYCTNDRSRSFSSYAGTPIQSKPGEAKAEIMDPHGENERRAPMARAMWKGPFVDAFLLRMKKRKESISNKKIWSRRSVILPEFVNCIVRIYNGKTFIRRKITEGMVGHKFGEFALTRKRRVSKPKSDAGPNKKKGKR